MGEDDTAPSENLFRRESPALLRNVETSDNASNFIEVLIGPVWVSPSEPITRFQQIDISVHQHFGIHKCSLQKSKFTVSRDRSQRLMTYIYRMDSGTAFAVKAQWAEFGAKVAAKAEMKCTDEENLQQWAAEFIDATSDEAEVVIHAEYPFLRAWATIRYGVQDNASQGHSLNLVLRVGLDDGNTSQSDH